MAGDDDFEPDDLQFQISGDGKSVRLIFIRDNGEHQAVVLRRSHLASLVAGAQKLLSPRDAVPIDRDSLRPGMTLELTSYQFSPRGCSSRAGPRRGGRPSRPSSETPRGRCSASPAVS